MSRIATLYAAAERFWWNATTRKVVIILATLTIVRLWAATATPLLWDEPYYWLWSRHLSLSYFDHPPMVALWMAAGTAIAGDGVLGLRLSWFLNFAIGPFIVYAVASFMFDRTLALRAVLWANVTPLLGIAGFIATPDGPSTFFWLAATLAYVMVVKTGRGHWWLAVGLCAGLGLLSKYTNLFLGAGIVLSLALDPKLRRWLISPWTWAGGLLALAIFSPVIVWNASNDWASFRFQFGRVSPEGQDASEFLTLLVVQPLIFNPLAAVFLAIGVTSWLRRRNIAHGREIGILFATVIPALVFILYQATQTFVLQHWLAPTFPVLAIIAVAGASTLSEAAPAWLRRMRTDVVPFAITCMVVVFAYVTTPADRYFPGKDPIDSMRGWPDFSDRVSALREEAGAAWIAGVGYALTSQLAYELRDRAIVIPVTERARWGFLPTPDAARLDEPALLLTHRDDPVDRWRACFSELTDLGTVERWGAVKELQTVRAYLASGARSDIFETGCDNNRTIRVEDVSPAPPLRAP